MQTSTTSVVLSGSVLQQSMRPVNNDQSMISFTYCDVPQYLHNSAFFLSLDAEDSAGLISVPKKCFKSDDSVNNVFDFARILRVMKFWGAEEIPAAVLNFCANNDMTLLQGVIDDILKEFILQEILHHRFRRPHDIRDAMRCNQWGIVTHWMDCNPPESANGQRAFEDAAGAGIVIVQSRTGGLSAQRNITIQLQTVMELHQRGYHWWSEVSAAAAWGDNLDCLQYLHRNGCPIDHKCMDAAAGRSVDCMKYLHEHSCPWDKSNTCEIAMREGKVQCLQFAYEQGCTYTSGQIIHEREHSNAELDCIRYILDQMNVIDKNDCFRTAYGHGTLEILQLLREYDAPWDVSVSSAAVAHALPFLKYVMTHGCPYSPHIVCSAAAAYDPLTDGCERVQYLVEEMLLPMDETVFSTALLRGNVEAVQYLVDAGCPCAFVPLTLASDFVLHDARILESMVYAVEQGWPCNEAFQCFVHTHELSLCQQYFPLPSAGYDPGVPCSVNVSDLHQYILTEALHIAAMRNQYKHMKYLTQDGIFPAHNAILPLALVHGSVECVTYLVSKGWYGELVVPEVLPQVLDDARILQCIECVHDHGLLNNALMEFVIQHPLPLCQAYVLTHTKSMNDFGMGL